MFVPEGASLDGLVEFAKDGEEEGGEVGERRGKLGLGLGLRMGRRRRRRLLGGRAGR